MLYGSILQKNAKIGGTFSPKRFCSTFFGIVTTSKHPLVEHWVFAYYGHFMFTSLFGNSELTSLLLKGHHFNPLKLVTTVIY